MTCCRGESMNGALLYGGLSISFEVRALLQLSETKVLGSKKLEHFKQCLLSNDTFIANKFDKILQNKKKLSQLQKPKRIMIWHVIDTTHLCENKTQRKFSGSKLYLKLRFTTLAFFRLVLFFIAFRNFPHRSTGTVVYRGRGSKSAVQKPNKKIAIHSTSNLMGEAKIGTVVNSTSGRYYRYITRR